MRCTLDLLSLLLSLLHTLRNHLAIWNLLPLLGIGLSRLRLSLLPCSHHLRVHLPIERLARMCARRSHAVHLGLGSQVVAIHSVEEVWRYLRIDLVAHEAHGRVRRATRLTTFRNG